MRPHTLLGFALIASTWVVGCVDSARADDEKKTKCESCRKLVEDFVQGKERTARDNFAGGDVAWEEEKQLSYATSETRLIEIMEGVCTNDHKCQYLMEEHEELLETWWFKNQKKHTDLYIWLCIQRVKVCCANGTFGKACQECPGGTKTPCSGQGKCEGDGDREGKGTCSCNAGYGDKTCASCSAGYYTNSGDDKSKSLECLQCSKACEGNCTGPSAGDCEDCAKGYEEEEGVCADQDECSDAEKPPCEGQSGTHCENTEGSYRCAQCHSACNDSCTGAGATACLTCATGYTREDDAKPCEDIDECKDHQSRWLPPPRPSDPNELYPGCNFTTFCHNTVGSFECRECDASCDGCSGSGAEACLKCSQGYELRDKTCSDVDECSAGSGNCDAELEVCINIRGSFRCDCASGRKRVDGKCPPKPAPEDDDDEEDSSATEKDEL